MRVGGAQFGLLGAGEGSERAQSWRYSCRYLPSEGAHLVGIIKSGQFKQTLASSNTALTLEGLLSQICNIQLPRLDLN